MWLPMLNPAHECNEITPSHPEPLLTRRELAKLCKVSTRTIDSWVANKRIPVLRGPSERCVRFSWAEVVKSLRSAEEGSCN